MDFYDSLEAVPKDFGPSAVAIGKFDGMHSGHQRILADLLVESNQAGLVAVAVTFDRNPLSLLRPDVCPDPLISNQQRVELIEATGVDVALMLTFDRAFSEQSPREFVERILVTALHTRIVFVGADFRFGARGSGTVEALERFGTEFGFAVRTIRDVVPAPHDGNAGSRRVSSTWIRELLADGRVGEAGTLLGREPSIRGVVVDGEKRGRTFGYPTANLSQDFEGYLPADGVYAARIRIGAEQYGAAVSIGNNPTFEGVPARQVEAHVLDESLDLYGHTVELAFVEYVRAMRKFPNTDALVLQMQSDERQIREILSREIPNGG